MSCTPRGRLRGPWGRRGSTVGGSTAATIVARRCYVGRERRWQFEPEVGSGFRGPPRCRGRGGRGWAARGAGAGRILQAPSGPRPLPEEMPGALSLNMGTCRSVLASGGRRDRGGCVLYFPGMGIPE